MDRITELYAKSAYDGRTTSDVVNDLRSAAAVVVLIAGIAVSLALPILAGWALLSGVGFH